MATGATRNNGLDSWSTCVRTGERAALALVDIGAVERLIEAFRTTESWKVRLHAVCGFANSPDPAVEEAVIKALSDSKAEVRRAAARAFDLLYIVEMSRLSQVMSRPKDPRAIDALIAALRDKDRWTRQSAAGALEHRLAARAIEPLIAILDDKREIREAAAKSLKRVTGQDLGEDQATWQRWWNDNRETLELPGRR
ncbi:MAG: HEAT repeat domain-containing protein [Acidobacteriota bacterium]